MVVGEQSADAGTRSSEPKPLPVHVRQLRAFSVHFRSPWPVVVLAALTLFLGYWGFSELADQASITDRTYNTVQLLSLNAAVPDSGTPWQLDVSRFVAPFVLPSAALVALLAPIGLRAERLRMRMLGNRHVLVVGAGGRGATLTRTLAEMRKRYNVVVLESDSASGIALSLRRQGIPVVYGDARSPDTVAAVRSPSARSKSFS